MAAEPRLFAISDGRAGNARQAEALAAAIGGEVAVFRAEPNRPWRWFAPRLTPGYRRTLPRAFGAALAGPPPDILVGCGRQAAFWLRALKRHCPNSFAVQILDPRVAWEEFDVIICPEHDQLAGPNVLVTLGALHDMTAERLRQARRHFSDLDRLPRPITSLLIGGPSPMLPLNPESIRHLLSRIEHLPGQHQGTLLVTTSRRTPKAVSAQIAAHCAAVPGTQCWSPDQPGDNPYIGFLACADRIVVTPDSVNMLSEAVAVGVPVYTLCEQEPTGKFAHFHQALKARGLLHPLGTLGWPRPPLRETENIAETVRARWQAFVAAAR